MSRPSPYALVLTTTPGEGRLTASVVGRAESCLTGLAVRDERWLAPGDAWDAVIELTPEGASELRRSVVAALSADPIDVNVVCAAPDTRRKQLLVADMDSTIIQQECIDEMADVLGLKPRIAAITERAMRGELQFEEALRERLGLLQGIASEQLDAVYRERLTLMSGASTLVATMRANGAMTALVSGGFTYFTARIASRVGFKENHANTLELRDGRLTGNVVGPILGREAKLATLKRLTADHALDPAATLAVGDGANDLDMIRAAGLGVAYRAKPIVAAEAAAEITHGDLTALLYLQGYQRAEFVSP